mgnify:CR=1 FL=1
MSERAGVDILPSPSQTNGAGGQGYHGRVADLLDDVTVRAQPVATVEDSLDELFAAAPATLPTSSPQPPSEAPAPRAVEPPPLPSPPPATFAAPPPASPPAAAEPAAPVVDLPAWVPPWDESQRPAAPVSSPSSEAAPSTPLAAAPVAAAPAAAAPAGTPPVAPPRSSIFAPLAAEQPPADLPPFLAAEAAVAAAKPADAPSAVAEGNVPADMPAASEGAAMEAAPPAEAVPAAAPPISIRGRMDGLAVEVGAAPWPDVIAALTARLGQSSSFFRNANVALDLGQRALAEEELNAVAALLRKHDMNLALVRTGAERTFQAALALGLTATLEGADGAAMAEATAAQSNAATGGYFVYRGYLRSGNRLRRQEHVLVIGDVNPGAEVISDGDVLVWGRLRGIAHAGAAGNVRAIVAALDMEPTQLRIADVMTTSPDPQPGQPGKWFWQRSAHKRPEVARLINKAIAFEEWDAGRPGGLVSLRRSG